MADNRPGKLNLPPGIKIPELITQIKGENKDASQIKLAIATTVFEIETINFQSLEEAMKRPDNAKWETAITGKLINLQKARIWTIVESVELCNLTY